jgi:hypothetical protein
VQKGRRKKELKENQDQENMIEFIVVRRRER